MNKKCCQLFISLLICSLSISTYAQDIFSAKIVDSHTGSSVPFAYIKIKGSKKVFISDPNGCFKINISQNDTLELSHVAYRPLIFPLRNIKNNHVFMMEELPVSLNPIVVTADWAESQLSKALKLTHKKIKIPSYYKLFRIDQISFNGFTVKESVSESDVHIKELLSPSHGAYSNFYLRNIINDSNEVLSEDIPEYLISNGIPVNNFLIGVSRKIDKWIYFFSQEVNDSVLIISYRPVKGHEYSEKSTVTRGRFFIDRISGRFFRIDCEVDQEMLAYQRELAAMRDSSSRFYYAYSFSMKLDDNSYPSEVDIEYSFSYGKDDPGSMWQNRCQMRFIPLKEKPDLSDKSKLVPRDSLFINMASSFDDKFSQKIEEIFK
jgi:hypothetical protein